VISFDDSNVPTRLITLGVALVAFGLGCHFWTDRVSRIAGLIIGAIQLCRYLLTTRISKTKTEEMSEKRLLWLRTCDHITAVLLIMETIHAVTSMAI
jgi:hypothetical protein